MTTQDGLPTTTDTPDICLECGEPLEADEPAVEVPGYPGRRAHRSCRFTVVNVAFQAVGL